MDYRALAEFCDLFANKQYSHRNSSQGDRVAIQVYEDLFALQRNDLLHERLSSGTRVINTSNKRVGIDSRRGDGTLGEPLPGHTPVKSLGFEVSRGPIATIEIGIEVKILAKAMIKQIDRVVGDLAKQAAEFRKDGDPICVGIVGINTAEQYTSYEGERSYMTDGKKAKHPIQEAQEAERRIVEKVPEHYDILLVWKFSATNVAPFPFEWASPTLASHYGAALVRLANLYCRRFKAHG
jgi:hypothetical protein